MQATLLIGERYKIYSLLGILRTKGANGMSKRTLATIAEGKV